MKIFRIILFFPLALLRFILVLLVSAVIGIAGMIWLKLFGFSRHLQKSLMQFWGKSMMVVCGIKVIHNQIPDHQHFILMANHRSYLDIVVLAAFLPASFVAKMEVQSWPLMKTAARLTNIIFVSRSDFKSLVFAMKKIELSVSQGIPVALFPEGTTFRGPLTQSFKKGSFKIAVDLEIPVIAAAIHYEDEEDAWINDDTFIGHFFRQMGKPVTRVHLGFGKPMKGNNTVVLRENVKEEINSMLQDITAKEKKDSAV